jgi:hypothetical protein
MLAVNRLREKARRAAPDQQPVAKVCLGTGPVNRCAVLQCPTGPMERAGRRDRGPRPARYANAPALTDQLDEPEEPLNRVHECRRRIRQSAGRGHNSSTLSSVVESTHGVKRTRLGGDPARRGLRDGPAPAGPMRRLLRAHARGGFAVGTDVSPCWHPDGSDWPSTNPMRTRPRGHGHHAE